MSHSHHHDHSHSVTIRQANKKAFIVGIILNSAFVLIEVVAGFIYNSVALLTDAGHNISDVASLVLSLLSFHLAQKKATQKFTYGYKKTTILAALTNAVILLIAIGVLGYESVSRLKHPEPVKGNVIAWVAALGIVVNSISAFVFFKNRETDLNTKGAYLHLLSDAMVSLGVVIGGIIISYTRWYWIDPIIGLMIMAVILVSTWSILKDSFNMAVDAVPEGIDMPTITNVMSKVPYVTAVHHIHIWPLSTTENALTAHVVIKDSLTFAEKMKVVKELKHELEHHNIHHSTIEVEIDGVPPTSKDC